MGASQDFKKGVYRPPYRNTILDMLRSERENDYRQKANAAYDKSYKAARKRLIEKNRKKSILGPILPDWFF